VEGGVSRSRRGSPGGGGSVRGGGSCDDPAGRRLGRGGPTNPPRKEQCGGRCTPSRHTGPGVQRPKAPTTNKVLLAVC